MFTFSVKNPDEAIAALLVQTPFLEVEVGELIFDGYADPFIDQVCSLPFVNFVCEQILELPDRIGLFYKKNGSSTGVFEVEDGHKDNGESLGKIITWNNSTSLPESWWESAQALRIDGTDGTLMPPYVSKTDVIPVFVAELCRTIDLVFQKEVEYAGVPLYRFIMPKDAWDWNLPSNKGFCKSKTGKRLFKEQNSDCLPVGLLDVSRCQIGEPPIVVSQPNFLYSPDYVQQSIEGIQFPAIQERDQIEIDVEPRLGTIIQAHRRFLISISMWKGANLSLSELAHFQSSVVPVLEIDEYIHVDDDSLDLIKTKLLLVEKSAQIGSICGVVFSLMAISAVVAFIFYRKCRRGKSAKRHLSNGRAIVSPTPLAVPNGHTFDQSTF
uniref:Glycoprotein n=1 Tax=Meloidogyne hapla TaxID=6305 RepID=A0A1I8C2M6_MELHA